MVYRWQLGVLTPEAMRLVDQSGDGSLVSRCIVLQAPEYSRGIHICFARLFVVAVGRATGFRFDALLAQERPRSATLAFAACSLWHGDLEQNVVSGDCRGEQSLGKRVVRPE